MTRTFLTIAATAVSALLAQSVVAQQTSDSTGAPPATDAATPQSGSTSDSARGDSNHNAVNSSNQQTNQGVNTDQRQSNDATRNDSRNRSEFQSQNRPEDNQTRRSFSNDNRSNDQNRSEQSRLRSNAPERQARGGDQRRGIEFGNASDRGLTIRNVERNSIYYNSGIRQNDVIISVDGRAVRNDRDFYGYFPPGARVPVLVLRDGREETVYVTYNRDQYAENRDSGGYEQSSGSQAYLGVRFEGRVRDGAIVSSVIPGSPAEDAGLQRGDEIVAINGREIRSPSEVTRIVSSMQPGDTVDIDFSRRVDERTQAVLEGHEGSSLSSTSEYRQEVYRGGPQYDGVEGRQLDQSYQDDSQQRWGDSRDGYDKSDGRRNGRSLLPRLRN